MGWKRPLIGFVAAAFVALPMFVSAQVESLEFRVDGVSCSGCALRIKSALKPFESIEKIDVDVDEGVIQIRPSEEKWVPVYDVEATLGKNGFPSLKAYISLKGKILTLAAAREKADAKEAKMLDALLEAAKASKIDLPKEEDALLVRVEKPFGYLFLLEGTKEEPAPAFNEATRLVGKTVTLTGLLPKRNVEEAETSKKGKVPVIGVRPEKVKAAAATP